MPRKQLNDNRTGGSTKTDKVSKLQGLLKGKQASEPVDWTAVDPGYVLSLIAAIANEGGAVRFGYTRDGGSYTVGIYLGDERENLYFRDIELLHAWIATFCEELGQL